MSLNDFRHCNVSSFHITQTTDYSRLEDTNVSREWRSASITVGHPFIDRAFLSQTKYLGRYTAAIDRASIGGDS